ncbi:MAG: 3-oxoacid CoA-transferase subunit A [Proteobacteria bacterium]|nr:3-oxoacid CoA-transferase subunit A [Pseudomonadota bacterium]
MDKIQANIEMALEGIADGSVILIGGFGNAGEPIALLNALADKKPKDLTVVTNNAGSGEEGIGRLLSEGCVRKAVCSFPRVEGSVAFEKLYEAGKLELELVPQGTIAERVRSAGAGIPGFYTRTSFGTELGEGKEVREFDGVPYVFEEAIYGDVALVKAHRGDRWGNLTYLKSARNFNPVMAMGATVTVAQVSEVAELGDIDPEHVITPSIFVDRVVKVEE